MVRQPEDEILLIGIVGEEERILDSDIDGETEAGKPDGNCSILSVEASSVW